MLESDWAQTKQAAPWIRFGADGWRLDVAAEINDDDFWREFRRRVRAVNPEAYIVAEVWHEDHRWLQGDQFDAYMNYPLGHAILSFAAGDHRDEAAIDSQASVREGMRRVDGPAFLERVDHLLRTYDPAITAAQLNLLGSHDTPRIVTLCGGDTAAVRLATVAQMTLPGAPCIYYGDEIGMSGGNDPDCRGPFPADPSAGDQALRAFVRGVAALRHRHAALRDGPVTRAGAAGLAAAYLRADDREAFVVALNAGEALARLDVDFPDLDGRRLEPASPDGWGWPPGEPVQVVGGRASIELPARSARLLVAAR